MTSTSPIAATDRPQVVELQRQLIKDAHMLIIGYRPENPDAIADVLPGKLTPHPDGVILLNLWVAPDPGSSSGLDGYAPMSCSYIAPEVSGWDTETSDGNSVAHGRYFAQHWLEHDGMRAYAKASCGAQAEYGRVEYLEPSPGVIVAELLLDGKVVIRVTASVSSEKAATVGGHLNYFTILEPSGDAGDEGDVARIRVPFVADISDADITSIEWLFPADHPAAALAPKKELDIASLLYGKVTWTPFTVAEIL